ncbi:MAG: MCE family protein [Nannocystaceae bacterium]|nr:MCE family protein [Nannocystaceae bacterium]
MASRRNEQRVRVVVGLFVVALSALLFASLFIIGQNDGTWESKTTINTHFNTITGLSRGPPVQLAGVEIGNVTAINFVNISYPCTAATEDRGRFGGNRTDDCDAFLFCAPDNWCADLEEYASKGQHAACADQSGCASDEVCVTKEFRRRARRVPWAGPDGVCARYSIEHRRVEVQMTIFEDKLDLIRTDSYATVASNGVLGDQLVNITPGQREPLDDDDRRIQSTPSLIEDINLFRDRFDGVTDKVDAALQGVSSLFSELNDQRTIAAVKGTLENVEEITRQIAAGEGLAGALLSDSEMKKDFGLTLRSARDTAHGIDAFVGKMNRTLVKIDDKVSPVLDDVSATFSDIRETIADLKNPANKSLLAKLIYDEEGKIVADVESIVADFKDTATSVKHVAARIDAGEGTLGKLISDSKVHDDLVKLFQNVDRNSTLKRVVRHVMELDDVHDDGEAAPTPTGGPTATQQ